MRLDRAGIARWLEADDPRSPALEVLASMWAKASASRVRRPLAIPAGVHAIGIGGATLGGSGKTPLAIELARAIALRGERVSVVGHAYRARPRWARLVATTDDVRDVGDEALLARRCLESIDVDVVVAPTRQQAVDLAARRSTVIVLDGVLQTRPRRLARSLLVLDEHLPWGNGRCPPAGDLRAPRESLLAAADAVVRVHDAGATTGAAVRAAPAYGVTARLERAIGPSGAERRLSELRGVAFGLILAIARPARVARSLARLGLHPAARIDLADHAVPTPPELERAAAIEQRVQLWLTTPKCAVKLPAAISGAPVFALDRRLHLPEAWVDWALSKGPLPDALSSFYVEEPSSSIIV